MTRGEEGEPLVEIRDHLERALSLADPTDPLLAALISHPVEIVRAMLEGVTGERDPPR